MADVHVQPTRKRRRTETTEISSETYDVTDYIPVQDELINRQNVYMELFFGTDSKFYIMTIFARINHVKPMSADVFF